MSDENETFLARWSKRKAQARTGETAADDPQRAQSLDVVRPSGTDEPEQDEVPLEDLPPIESIDASTDLTPWLRKKVPEAWRRAALSRIWASDPAISEFVGLADYAWDWNAPDGVPGFGPLRAADNVAALLSQAIGQMSQQKPDKDVAEATDIAETGNAEAGESDEELGDMPKESSERDPAHGHPSTVAYTSDTPEGIGPAEPENPIRRRRGGGALPI